MAQLTCQYLSRELLLANGVIEVKGESGGNRPLIEGGSDEKDEKQRSDVKPDFSKGPTSVSAYRLGSCAG